MTQLNAQRRRLLNGAGAVAAASFIPALSSPGVAKSNPLAKTFVLVHGAWHGGWCWKQVCQKLAMAGHMVYAPSLTGLGDRSHLLTSEIGLQTHVDDISNIIQWNDLSDIVLVGHSYAGMVISGVASEAASKISSIIYLDALIPYHGQSAADLTTARVKATLQKSVNDGKFALSPPSPSVFKLRLQNEGLVQSKMTSHPIATLLDASHGDIRSIDIPKKTYMRLQKYPHAKLDEYLQEIKELKDWSLISLDVGHDMMIDHPTQLAELLLQYA